VPTISKAVDIVVTVRSCVQMTV